MRCVLKDSFLNQLAIAWMTATRGSIREGAVAIGDRGRVRYNVFFSN